MREGAGNATMSERKVQKEIVHVLSPNREKRIRERERVRTVMSESEQGVEITTMLLLHIAETLDAMLLTQWGRMVAIGAAGGASLGASIEVTRRILEWIFGLF